jgi:laminin, alpha 1/2
MKSESIHNRANRIFGSSDREYQRVERMNSEAQNLLMDIRDIDGIVQETIINLRNYGNNENHIKLPTALREAKMYLNDIKNQSQNIPNSEDSLDCANENYETWNSMNNLLNKSKEKLDNFINSHKNLNDRLDDLKNLTHRTFRDASESEVFLTKNNKGLERLREKANFLNSELTALDELFDFNLIASSESLLEMAHDGVSRLSIQNREMNELQKIVDDKIAEDESELFVVKNNIVPEARRHAEEISKRSKVIVDAYENSKSSANNAILAVTAHKNITDAVYVAENAANRAHEAATIADLKLNPEDEETIVEKGNEMSLESEDIQEDAKQQMSKIEGEKI